MELNPALAQFIVDYTSRIVEYTINIMNPEAVIIASTNPGRIGERHIGAQKVLDTGEPYIITEEIASNYDNVIPGISLPIHFHEEIIGVVGVGAGDHATVIGKMIQSTTELLIEQQELRTKINAMEQMRSKFLMHLLTEPWTENELYFNQQIKQHHLNKEQGYLVAAAEFSSPFITQKGVPLENLDAVDYEKSLRNLTDRYKTALRYPEMLLVYLPNMITFLIPYAFKTQEDYFAFEQEISHKLMQQTTLLLGTDCFISIGGLAKDMTHIRSQYKHALVAIHITKRIRPKNKICTFRDVSLEYQMLSIPAERRERYYRSILGELLKEDEKSGIWLTTLECFFKNDQNVGLTAQELYIHRNTLTFRLSKIQKMTGLHPQHFKDAACLHTALIFYKLKDYKEETM